MVYSGTTAEGERLAEGRLPPPSLPHHTVQFYEDDEFVCDAVAKFLGEGAALGDSLVVIATGPHRNALCRRLESQGIDVGALQSDGRLVLLDAEESLARFMRNGQPDRELFDAAVGRLIAATLGGLPAGARLRAYGEMVDVLWRDGQRQAAIQLEDLWNELQTQYSFTLLCAYAMASFYREPAELQDVCATHTHVVTQSSIHEDGDGDGSSALPPAYARALAKEIAHRREVESSLRETVRKLRSREEELRRDVTERRRVADRAERLLRITGAIADAVSAEQVFEALVDRVVEAIDVSTAGLWLLEDGGQVLRLARARGYDDAARREFAAVPLFDPMEGHEAIWIPRVPALGSHRMAWLPLLAHGRVLGALGVTVDDARDPGAELREFLELVTRYASQALERLRLLDAERASRARADAAAERLGVLSHVSRAFAGSELDLESRLEAVITALASATDSRINVALVEPDGRLRVRVSHDALAEVPGVEGMTATISAPLTVRGRAIGTVTASRVREGQAYTDEDLRLLEELSERAAVAIENSRLYEETMGAWARTEELFRFAHAVVAADRIDVVYEAALASIEATLETKRTAILTFDADGVMRFRAWHGLSDMYRVAVEGHSPWPADVVEPEPVLVSDALSDPSMTAYRPLFEREGIGALAFIPLVTRGRLLGKFVVYYDRPHRFSFHEVGTASAIANHLGSVTTRFAAVTNLEETIRQNELFAGVLAHDLRNPLAAMMTAAQLVLMRSEGTSAGTERDTRPLSRIMSSGLRMRTMIDQLLDFTRARSGGGIPIDPHATDLGDLCAQAVSELELSHPEWNIRRQVAGDQRGTWDSDRLLQALSNLVSNAGQHGTRGEPISIELDGTHRDHVTITIHNYGAVPEALLTSLFDPFRSTQHRRDQSRGLGLGLFIVREIVRSHRGSVDVASSEAAGTTFTIQLPRHAEKKGSPA